MSPKFFSTAVILGATLILNSARAADAPTTAPSAAAPARGRGGRNIPATPADLAEIAMLDQLPAYSNGAPDGDYFVGPAYTPAPEQTARDGVPQGKIVQFTMDSTTSKMYPGIKGPFKRDVYVYVPSQYVSGKPLPFIVSADHYGFSRRQLPNILDNMIADHHLPIMAAIMVSNGGGDGPGSERGLEYDTVSSKYADFVESEILPRVESEAKIVLSKDPDARMTYGGSSGGAVAFTMAWYHPELYHRVLTYSGTFVNQQAGPDAPHGAWNYHETFLPNTDPKPLRIWMEVGQNDNGAKTASSGRHNWLIANERMAAVMKAKGYHYQLVYAKAAGHTDAKAIAQTLPEALEYVWRGYPIAADSAK